MGIAAATLSEEYWENFALQAEDIEFVYNYLLETETPLTSLELVSALVKERLHCLREEIEQQRTAGGDLYQPKLTYQLDQKLIFPVLNWKRGQVVSIRPGVNPDIGDFQVIEVLFEDGVQRGYAASLSDHQLNNPPKIEPAVGLMDEETVLKIYQNDLVEILEADLEQNPDFVRIAGRWFPQALLVDINIGHLNIAEAVLDMAGGGPLPTNSLLEQVGVPSDVNVKLLEFSMDHVLQEDTRFDEVGPAGDTLWFLRRLEPAEVNNPPIFLRYNEIEYDRSILTNQMLELEQALEDELSPVQTKVAPLQEVEVRLIFPHWRTGTLPLSAHTQPLFPTAYEAPRVRFMLVDGETKEKFPGWVVREQRYVYGLEQWYDVHGVLPGSMIRVRAGETPGEVEVYVDNHRPSREWIRTLLVGSDGGIVFAMLKQIITTPVDERMAIAVPDKKALDPTWSAQHKNQPPFEKLVVNMVRDLARLNPQGHVHFTELYSGINILRRCPPGPIMALLASRSWFIHVGDMHYRLSDLED